MGVLELARAHLRRRRALARRAAAEVARLWARVDRRDIARSWADSIPAALTVVESAQAIAAASAGAYLDDLLDEYGMPGGSSGVVRSISFAGMASDGRPLDSLLERPAFTALKAIKARSSEARAMAAGRFTADLIVRTQVADAGRVADGVALTARRQLTGYVRMLSLPSCARCIILAGRWYAYDAGFARHPLCDCLAVPSPEDVSGDLRTDPRLAFEAMEPAEQDGVFTKAGAQAIRDGADLSQVVNARRGIEVAGRSAGSGTVRVLRTTRTGTTRRALAGRRLGARQGRVVRLTPEAIYQQAAGDRERALELLYLHGYLL